MVMRLLIGLWLLLGVASALVSGLVSCNTISKPVPESKAHHAAYAAEEFVWDRPRPTHPANFFDFYYKHCTTDGHQPYPAKTGYECTSPD